VSLEKSPACPVCSETALVRAEQVISGRRVTDAYYCGRCNHEWQIEATHTPERRIAERRKRIDGVIRKFKKKPARVSLGPKPDYRRAKRT
jgi:transposase-like protein